MPATAASRRSKTATLAGHYIVCGLGQLGLRVAEVLCELGESVTVLAPAAHRDFAARVRAAGARVVDGSSEVEDDLVAAGVREARCLVLTEDADLGNLRAALEAKERNSDIRVVLRMFNIELAHRASALLSNTEVMSLAGVAAPFLVTEALGESTETLTVWDRRLMLREAPSEEASVLARLAGDLVLQDGGAAARAARRSRARTLEQAVRILWDRRLATVLAAVGVVITISSVAFWYLAGFSPIDAAYFTVTTMTTVGYGDLNLLTQPWEIKVMGMVLMFLGATSLAAFYALVTDAVVGARIQAALGVPDGTNRGHFVVCGVGNIGFRVIEHLLSQGHEVTACDIPDDRGYVEPTRRLGVPLLAGDALVADNLRLLGVERARAVIATTENDVTNLEIALASRELNPEARLVARIFDTELAARAELQFGIHACRSVSSIAAPYFAAAALGSDVKTMIRHHEDLWLLAEARVEAGSEAAGKTHAWLEEQEIKLMAVRNSDAESWHPDSNHVLNVDEELLVALRRGRLETFRRVTPGNGAAAGAGASAMEEG
ncbi:MAG: hypothetical protein QOE92_1551 [Chloroflexota bacterium]|nr:hypothetical protein [Chloroflexota bacterium]